MIGFLSGKGLCLTSVARRGLGSIFRHESDRDTWLEQMEIKHAEFGRAVQSFGYTSEAWARRVPSAETPGHAAYARKQSAKYAKLKQDAEDAFKRVGMPMFREIPAGTTLIDQMVRFRVEEERRFPAVNA